jgi:hypothetical protein
VVWPFQKVRVVFPDGSEFREAPVVNWDLLGDLAIIRLLHASINPVVLGNGEDQITGSDVFLIGYPGEVEQFPQPTITRGLISRRREWEPIDMTYFQTDAKIAGGQSGGVLVSKTGEVIGISGFAFTEGDFGLVASAADVLPRLQKLIAAEDIAGFGARQVPLEGGQQEQDFTLRHYWDTRAFVINEPIGTTVDLKVEGENDVFFGLVDIFGQAPLLVNQELGGTETGSTTTEWAAPYFVVLGQSAQGAGTFHISSNHRLIPYNDPDDGMRMSVGQTSTASIDYPGDTDYFVIGLDKGDTINLAVDSVLIDPVLSVDYLGSREEELIWDDNSGGGFFGLNPALTYRAPRRGSYFIIVADQPGYGVGGYFLSVAAAPPGAIPAAPQPTPTVKSTLLGPEATTSMTWYKSAQYPFALQYPAQWTEQSVTEGVTAAYAEGNSALVITEEDLIALGAGEMKLEDYVDVVLYAAAQKIENYELLSREQTVNHQGLPIQIVTFSGGPGNIFRASVLIYVHENKVGFNALYIMPKGTYQELKPLIDASFSTFESGEE